MLAQHNARLEFDRTDPHGFGDELLEALAAYQPAVSVSALGRVQSDVTFLAGDVPHVVDMALEIAAEAPAAVLVAVEVMSAADFDRL